MDSKKKVYVVWSNTDLTEGKGYQFPLAVCELKATAIRMGKRAYVQGCDCPIEEVEVFWKDRCWWGPVWVSPGTQADAHEEPIITAREEAIKKAREKGLTEDEIAAIMAK